MSRALRPMGRILHSVSHPCRAHNPTSGVTPYPLSKKQISYTQHNSRNINSKNAYLYDLYRSLENCKNGNSLYKLSCKIKGCQIYDLYIWRLVEEKFFKFQKELTPKEISSIINHFKQIKINDSKIYHRCVDVILPTIGSYSLHDLSLLCLSLTYFNKVNTSFMERVADAIIKLYESEKAKIHQLCKKELQQIFISYVHIIGAYSKVGHKHIELFKIASVYIHLALTADVYVPSKILIKIVTSYACVKIKHSKIFELIAKQIPTVKITDDELKSIKRSFDQLGYSCETLEKYIQYRLS
ncbi:conserved Plasmodium protein, unknown function [Plasmodium vivax]|uniref:Uncharacterized protein n=6 Tax=Plasmodium vivax TaxID=5855 RepID=A5JZB3_PLAVS|nr:hypothetical protein, conserved [Plasmodium vivax]KMZ77872.1 hypothetical protein PVIIG_00559 [Plasmodium vivax India VII]KMZ84929.1 hypothetical protein PVBG_04345 [Plasmodium vivax Brazil I]KMZ90482.1 hypothetical protein PVMG_03331 [Plasmodium vivax Mauritania I]KMZ97099.1 hypothetical protein PVNG_00127 [Plasmodium vivax North Korean]EDL47324.1 hypothetical protein, conserved [Plasmodium vivax]|eukprot:XP_001617051.1 hypothetical protein [Plasmodium vivax Sal-1]